MHELIRIASAVTKITQMADHQFIINYQFYSWVMGYSASSKETMNLASEQNMKRVRYADSTAAMCQLDSD